MLAFLGQNAATGADFSFCIHYARFLLYYIKYIKQKLKQTERNEGSFGVWGPRKCLHFWGGYPIYIGLKRGLGRGRAYMAYARISISSMNIQLWLVETAIFTYLQSISPASAIVCFFVKSESTLKSLPRLSVFTAV